MCHLRVACVADDRNDPVVLPAELIGDIKDDDLTVVCQSFSDGSTDALSASCNHERRSSSDDGDLPRVREVAGDVRARGCGSASVKPGERRA